MLGLACCSLEGLSGEVSSEGRVVSVLLNLLLDFTDTSSWPAVPPPLLPPLNKLTQNFLQHLVDARLYSTLKVVPLLLLYRNLQ